MAKAPKPISAARQARKDRRTGFTRAERLKDRAICDQAAQRNRDNAILAKVLAAKNPPRGGISKERSAELQQLFKRSKIQPVTEAEIAAENTLREEALVELAEARARIDAVGMSTEVLAVDGEEGRDGNLNVLAEDGDTATKNKEEFPEQPSTTTRESTPVSLMD